ncbi:TOMM precursor leader peptide-binding protein [Baekduia sp. Peel2402]|uniref:TOMM precursor leader peptide-binding protein n=1 Tax=Baekduia sp. Peel2402 TaxID=3458296 RepID=UPI00403EB624
MSGVGEVYALRASVEVLEASDGRVYLLRPGASDLVVPEPDEVDRALLTALEVPSGIEVLVGRTGAAVEVLREKLDALGAAEVLASWPEDSPALDDDAAARFDRQLPYLAEFGPPQERQRALADATVAIIGCGGLGTWALGGLACAGVGSFILVDDDTVEPSNLNRQVLYVDADIGRPKVECAAEWVRRFAPRTAVETVDRRVAGVEDVAPLARAADIVVLLADWPPYELERWVNAACVEAGTPYIACGQATPIMKIGPMFVPGRTACFACEETQMRADSPFYDELVAMRRRDGRFAMTLGPASGLVGTVLSIEVMHALLGRPAATEGKAMLLDIQTFRTWWAPVTRDPACAVCGQVPQ